MLIVGPDYIGKDVLPLASDILYHQNLCYTQPTGFHPIEFHSVIGFPLYCNIGRVGFPKLIWEMPELYFSVAKDALEAHRIIEPLA